jgi:hypothetical protein
MANKNVCRVIGAMSNGRFPRLNDYGRRELEAVRAGSREVVPVAALCLCVAIRQSSARAGTREPLPADILNGVLTPSTH